MGSVGLKMLAVEAANTSQQITTKSLQESHWPMHLSDHLQQENSTDLVIRENRSRDESNFVEKDDNSTNYISQPHDEWEISKNLSRNVTTPQVENSTTSRNNQETDHQNSEPLSKYSIYQNTDLLKR